MANADDTVHVMDRPTHRVAIPKGRDPFVNTPLLSLGDGGNFGGGSEGGRRCRGRERFWISTWNSCVGTTAALIHEDGQYELYRPGLPHNGFYSAAQEDEQTLWLCGDLSRIVRMDLATGTFEAYETGASAALVFQGMRYDPATGKLFVAAFPHHESTTAIVFDTRARKVVRRIPDLCGAHYMRFSLPNGDGSYSFIFQTPGQQMLRWTPETDDIQLSGVQGLADVRSLYLYRLIHDSRWGWYLPTRGWYDAANDVMRDDGPRPQQEMVWFARHEEWAYGCWPEKGDLSVARWDLVTGHVEPVCKIPNANHFNVRLTASGKLVCVDLYGTFRLIDPDSGALEMSRVLPTAAAQPIDCLRRIDEKRLLGTPFITQRFWEVDLESGEGRDCGRAASGSGEVLQTWRIGGRIYMASYTSAELSEYDPSMPAAFPENPRVVAGHPRGMRPVAAADDGRHLWYASRSHYGQLGCTVTRYDTRTGETRYAVDPIPNLYINSMMLEAKATSLLCGTGIHADGFSAEPIAEHSEIVRLDARTLEVRDRLASPSHTAVIRIVGAVEEAMYLCVLQDGAGGEMAILDADAMAFAPDHPAAGSARDMVTASDRIVYHAETGLFLCEVEDRLEAWTLPAPGREQRRRVLIDPFRGERWFVDGRSIYMQSDEHVLVFEEVIRAAS